MLARLAVRLVRQRPDCSLNICDELKQNLQPLCRSIAIELIFDTKLPQSVPTSKGHWPVQRLHCARIDNAVPTGPYAA